MDSGTSLLDPDYEIANAWQRLIDGEYYENDILLLKHELYNCTQREAHDATVLLYDWANSIYK